MSAVVPPLLLPRAALPAPLPRSPSSLTLHPTRSPSLLLRCLSLYSLLLRCLFTVPFVFHCLLRFFIDFIDRFGSELNELIWFFCSLLLLCSLSVPSLINQDKHSYIIDKHSERKRYQKTPILSTQNKEKEKVLPLYNVMLEYRIGTP